MGVRGRRIVAGIAVLAAWCRSRCRCRRGSRRQAGRRHTASTTCCCAARTSSTAGTGSARCGTWRSPAGRLPPSRREFDPADAFKTIDVAGPLRDARAHRHPRAHLRRHRRSAIRTPATTASTRTASRFRIGVTTVVDAGGAGWRNFEDFKQRIIDRSKTRVLAFLNIVGNGMRGGKYEQDLADMEAAPTADMARRYPGLIVGIKTAHYAGPEWTPVERAVEAGTLADVPVMVDFGANRPERPLGELVTKKLRPGDIYTHVYSGLRGEQDRVGPREPGADRGPQARRHLRRRARRRQLPVADRGAGDEGRIPARFDLDRPAHRQHERRHEGHAQRDGQVPGDGHAARRRDRARRPGIRRARSSRTALGHLSRRRGRGRRRAAARARAVRAAWT